MNWFNRFFKKAPETPVRTSQYGESLSNWEMEYIERLQCPDCDPHPDLWEGPSGGLCINFKCPNCESKFNMMMGGYIGSIRFDGPSGIASKTAERISDRKK